MVRDEQQRDPWPTVTVIVPTYREVLSLPRLLARIEAVRDQHELQLDVLIMDDDSGDGTDLAVRVFARPWVTLVSRRERRGLSEAVVEGLQRARTDTVVIMDADLSHPPEEIPALLRELMAGADGALGSRYARGGSTDAEWGMFRWLNSRVATLLALPITRVADPMAGFFAMWRRDLARAERLDPIGYKIVLELIVKCDLRRIVEVPIHFTERRLGDSKLTIKQQLLYLHHVTRLYRYILRRRGG